MILGAIEYAQWKGSKSPPINQIRGKQAGSDPAKAAATDSQTGKIAAAGVKARRSEDIPGRQPRTSGERPEAAAAVGPPETASASSEKAPSSGSAAPPDPLLDLAAPTAHLVCRTIRRRSRPKPKQR